MAESCTVLTLRVYGSTVIGRMLENSLPILLRFLLTFGTLIPRDNSTCNMFCTPR
jgi:hypothetical protein